MGLVVELLWVGSRVVSHVRGVSYATRLGSRLFASLEKTVSNDSTTI
jgi:hypothetical protein